MSAATQDVPADLAERGRWALVTAIDLVERVEKLYAELEVAWAEMDATYGKVEDGEGMTPSGRMSDAAGFGDAHVVLVAVGDAARRLTGSTSSYIGAETAAQMRERFGVGPR